MVVTLSLLKSLFFTKSSSNNTFEHGELKQPSEVENYLWYAFLDLPTISRLASVSAASWTRALPTFELQITLASKLTCKLKRTNELHTRLKL
jgi:hypothetical protein